MTPELIIDEYGNKRWRLNGKLHREDGPAVEWVDGRKEWILNGLLHREDGPAVEDSGGTKYWYINGKRHREDGPAVEWADGRKSWYIDGEYINLKQVTKDNPDGYGPWSSFDLAKFKLKYL